MLRIFNTTKLIKIKIDTLNLIIKAYLTQKHKKKVTFYNILFKKVIINWTKLQCTQQKFFNNCNNIKKLKNIRKKNIIIYNIYESQKFIVFHNNKTIEQKTNEIIKTVKTIQIYYTIYI